MTDCLADPLLHAVTEVRGHKVLAPCVLLERIGEGGMGVVYRGLHLNLGIEVAVKVVPPSKSNGDPTFVQRFRREARSAARINHHNVVRVFDVESAGDLHYLTMEYVPGEDAHQRVTRLGPLPVGEALRIVHDASLGLHAAHREGIVHRDIKPGNLLISARGEVKVGDLGLAKPEHGSPDSMVSMAGVAVGTPAFMPPEQWEGAVTSATDVWAMGSTLYYLLTGQLAFSGDSVLTLMHRIATQPFPDIRSERADVPDSVVALLKRATASAPRDRFQDAGELAAAIAQLPVATSEISGVQAELQEQPTTQSPATRKWLDEVKDLISSDTIATIVSKPHAHAVASAPDMPGSDSAVGTSPPSTADRELDARHIRSLLRWSALAFVVSLAVGAIGGFMVWDAQSSGSVPAWLLLAPTAGATLVFMSPLYFLRKKWFPTKARLQAAVESLKTPKSQ
ncbi:MAG: serine/threonine protein kinase [Planctomycetota bacterium]|jgi:serine/threonine protein kinase